MAEKKAIKLGASGNVALPQQVFDEKFNGPLVHQTVLAELAAQRAGTASTKTRAMVRGGGVKPWRQKGTGRARAGSIRSPIWKGGGTVFGPSSRHFTSKVNRKARKKALRSALSVHAGRKSIAVLDPSSFDRPDTGKANELLSKWGADRPTLVLLADSEEVCVKSFRNLAQVEVQSCVDATVAEIIGAASLVVSPAAIDLLASRSVVHERCAGTDGEGD